MNKKINALAEFRETAKITLHDLAYLIGIDKDYLKKLENGNRDPSVTDILIYHMLFKARLEDMLVDLYAHLHAQLLERSETLITNLKMRQSPKSSLRIKAIQKIVNSLTHGDYGDVN